MNELRLLGVLLICVIVLVLVSASTDANDPFASGLLDTVFIFSCGAIGVFLLRKANSSQTLIVRQRGSRRSDLPVAFPLTDSRGIIQIKDRRRLPDRRKTKNDVDNMNNIHPKIARN